MEAKSNEGVDKTTVLVDIDKVNQENEKPEKEKKEKKRIPKKELTLEQRKKRSMLVFVPCISVVFLICMYWIFKPSETQELGDNVAGFNVDIPLPKEDGLISDKKKAYEMELLTQKQENRMQSLMDMSEELDAIKKETENSPVLNADLGTANTAPSAIQRSNSAYRDMNRELSSFYEPTQKSLEMQAMQEKVDALTARLEQSESGKNETEKQLAMMEKSYQMAAKYLTPAEESSQSSVAENEIPSNNAAVTTIHEKTVSGLQQHLSDSAFVVQYMKPRNMGFNTAIGSGYEISRNTIKACVYQDQTLENGQTVRLRLLEPLQAGKIVVPKNTLISGMARLQGERLDILIFNIEYAGNIIPVELAVYDTDGQKGINIPGSMEINAAKEAAANIGAGLGTSFSFAQSAGQQVAMDLTRGAMQAGSQYISKKFRAVKVNLKAGYQVILLAKEQ